MIITELPEDILTEILGQLRYKDVCSCRLTCRLFSILVNETPLIQYNSELDRAGLVDEGSLPDLSLLDRLKELRVVQKNWATLNFRGHHMLPKPPGVFAWELAGGILAYSHSDYVDQFSVRNGLTFIHIHSITPADRREPRTWTHRDIGVPVAAHFRDFTMDPSQDLIVLVTLTWETRKTDIHFRSINTGKAHPDAQQPIISCEPEHPAHTLVIRSLGEFVGVLFGGRRTGRDQLFIWNWKSGVLISLLESAEGITFGSFAFLTKHHFIVPAYDLSDQTVIPSLKIYDFSQPANAQLEPGLCRVFQLPLLKANFLFSDIIIRYSPFSGENTGSQPISPAYPFYTSPSSHIISISLQVTGESSSYCLMLVFFPSALLDDGNSSWQESVGWEAWGPEVTRILPMEMHDYTWINYSFGTRLVTVSSREDHIHVYDFNPNTICREPMDTSITDDEEDDVERMLQAHIGEEVRIFAHPIKTTLPFSLRKSKDSEIRWGYKAAMIDENCIIGLGRNGNFEVRHVLF
ncbi:hypothetical protein M422DRAFT_38195 [Sphaerobolus stellatus SS14]|uniref:F-box domain-containing protein n=1 Tax=Sphaerobolus stellatus (strain SS14) TaxID=990650 RepID=A0A0C9TBI6_SPHS4|nr:hypothetical protein M422DRAFT_38195 [Sphaerobolus stellatus SS14]